MHRAVWLETTAGRGEEALGLEPDLRDGPRGLKFILKAAGNLGRFWNRGRVWSELCFKKTLTASAE